MDVGRKSNKLLNLVSMTKKRQVTGRGRGLLICAGLLLKYVIFDGDGIDW